MPGTCSALLVSRNLCPYLTHKETQLWKGRLLLKTALTAGHLERPVRGPWPLAVEMGKQLPQDSFRVCVFENVLSFMNLD